MKQLELDFDTKDKRSEDYIQLLLKSSKKFRERIDSDEVFRKNYYACITARIKLREAEFKREADAQRASLAKIMGWDYWL